jgi:hypothetical protein
MVIFFNLYLLDFFERGEEEEAEAAGGTCTATFGLGGVYGTFFY